MTTSEPRTVEERIPLRNHDEERLVLGPYDRHARVVREVHRVTLVSRDGGLKLIGEAAPVAEVRERIEKILRRARAGDEPDEASMMRLLSATTEGAEPEGADAAARLEKTGPRIHEVRPRTLGQGRYLEAIRSHSVTIAIGPAGTGKTFLAVAMAVEALRRGEFRRLVLARPAVEAGERLGFLPGDLQAKVHPYLRPLYDALNDLLDPAAARRYVDNDVIEICPLAYMRGRTLNGAFIILDEAQNTTPKQMQMFLTRMGERGKIVVTGDVTQIDLPDHAPSGLVDARRRLAGIEGVAIVELDKSDIVRHPLVSRIVEAYEDEPSQQ
ncbi:MAG TPA: PhoH family protein [Planctomycetota bacterium]|nr:PhoH family protein [Planctomycetota bacterium]